MPSGMAEFVSYPRVRTAAALPYPTRTVPLLLAPKYPTHASHICNLGASSLSGMPGSSIPHPANIQLSLLANNMSDPFTCQGVGDVVISVSKYLDDQYPERPLHITTHPSAYIADRIRSKNRAALNHTVVSSPVQSQSTVQHSKVSAVLRVLQCTPNTNSQRNNALVLLLWPPSSREVLCGLGYSKTSKACMLDDDTNTCTYLIRVPLARTI